METTIRFSGCVADGGVVVSQVAPLDIVPANAAGLFFRDDQVALLDGKPWFPIGVCSMPALDPVAERLAESFELIVVRGGVSDSFASFAVHLYRER